MADDGSAERLAVLLDARISDFEKNMLKAAGISQKNFNAIRKDSASATRQMEADMERSTRRINQLLAGTSTRIGSFGKAFFGGVLGGLTVGSLTAIVGQLGDFAKRVADIESNARKVGLSTKQFQELGYVARQNGASVEVLASGMKTLAERADDFMRTGKGAGATGFQRLGYDAATLATKLKDPNALMAEIIGKLGQLNASARLNIADKIFGGSAGAEFVSMIGQGEQGIRNQIDAANELGQVLGDDVIQQAAEIDKRFNEIKNTIAAWVQPAVLDFLGDVISLMDRVRSLQNQSEGSLSSQLADIGKQRVAIENKILGLKNGDIQPDDGILGTSLGRSTSGEMIQKLERENEALAENERRIMDVVKARQKAAEETKLDPVTIPANGYAVPTKPKKPKAIAKTADDYFEQDLQAIRDRTAALREEIATLGMSFEEQTKRKVAFDLEKQALQDVREAARRKGDQDWKNVQLSKDQRAAIDEVSAAYARQAEEARKAQEMFDLQRDVLKGMFSDLTSALQDGKLSWEEMGNIAVNALNKIADKLLDDVLDAILQVNSAASGGGGGGILGGLMSLLGLGGGGLGSSSLPGLTGSGNLTIPWSASAKGNVFSGPGIGAFSNQIVTQPTVFPFAKGIGLMGEAGPEAIMPLRRGSDGRLGVSMTGGGGGANQGGGSMTVRLIMPEGWRSEIVNEARSGAQSDAVRIVAEYDKKTLPGSIDRISTDRRAR